MSNQAHKISTPFKHTLHTFDKNMYNPTLDYCQRNTITIQ